MFMFIVKKYESVVGSQTVKIGMTDLQKTSIFVTAGAKYFLYLL